MESACMLHTKHVKFNLKLASQCVSGSQAWPTVHQSLFHKKMPGPENKAVIVLLVFFSSRGSRSSDVPDSSNDTWPEAESVLNPAAFYS